MKLSDIKPGQVVAGEIKKLTEKGVYIRLTDHFDGFCPNTELADYHVKRARKSLPVKYRVLVADLENRFISLTRKKTLITSELAPLTTYSDIKWEIFTMELCQPFSKCVCTKMRYKVCSF